MGTTRQPDRRFPLSGSLYRGLRAHGTDPAAHSRPARVGVRTATELASGAITVAEAADRLGTAGYRVGRDGPGTAPPPTLDQITATRLVLEPAVAVRAARAVTPEASTPLRRRAGFLGTAAGVDPDPRRLFRHDCDGHAALYRLVVGADVPGLAGLCTLAHDGWTSRTGDPGDLLPVLRPHLTELGDVLRAVAAGEAERARELATAHVWGTHLMLLQSGADLPG